MSGVTMIDLLIGLAERTPDAPMIVHDDETFDFGRVAELAGKGAAWLASQGIETGDRVLLAISNRPLFLFHWFALLMRGAVAVPIAPETFGETLAYLVGQCEAAAILVDASEAARYRTSLATFAGPILSFDDEAAFIAMVDAFARATPTSTGDADSAAILYTSGTTGLPKGAMIPMASYVAAGREIARSVAITSDDRILVFLPLHHANPQMYAVMSALTSGCALVLLPRFSASTLLSQAARHRATGFTYVGTVLAILSKTIDGPRSTGLRWCVGGGAPEPVWRDLVDKLGIRIHELYGMTETGGVTTINGRAASRIGSVGRVRPDFEVVLVDDDDHVVPSGIGEIVVRPRSPAIITTGYFRKPAETVEATTNLWFHTGDYGRFDEDGFLFFEGRKKELIRRAGEMISPVAVELVANRHPSVADCAAVAVADAIVDEEIKLVVVERGRVDPDELIAYLAARLPRQAVPRYLDFVDAIPKTPTEKIQRFKLTDHSARMVDFKGPR